MFLKKKKQLDFLAIGDVVIDAFIELQDAWIDTNNPDGTQELCMSFGDKLPYKSVAVVKAVGNSPNAGVSAHRLGLQSAVLTDVGDDDFGQQNIDTFKKEGLPTSPYVRVHKGMGSNYHYVLRYKAERTILVKHQEYPYSFPNLTPAPRWVYLSSLATNSLPYHDQIADYLEKHPETKLAFQPGTFQMELGKEKLARLYKHSEIFFCNFEESQRILGTEESDIKKLLEMMRELGPNIVIITDGPKGAYSYDGNEMWHMPMYPDPAPPVDRTGAGDSFSSTFTSAIALGKTIPEALSWGPVNSMNVVQHIGAQEGLLSRKKLEEFLRNAPEDYKPTKIS